MLVVGTDLTPLILVGNECVGMADSAPLPMEIHLFQEFSLPSQPRDRSRPLAEILGDAGVGAGGAGIGVVGWKTFPDRRRLDIPAFLADVIREITGPQGRVENATDLLIDPGQGLRVINEVEQLAVFEHAACRTSDGVRRLLFGIEPGLTEREAVGLLEWDGTPLSCHLMLTAGDRARLGLLSPGDRTIERGDPFTVAFGIWGALNCRAGWVVADETELPEGVEDYVDRSVVPYFETVAEWYQALHVGQKRHVLHDIVERRLDDPFFGIFLNPGHQIHLDEWVNTPIAPGSQIELASGMALQVDIIPATGTPYFTTNIEDGIALADETLRQDFAARYPGAWNRIQRRREFMRSSLGIDLHPDVLPFSNIPAYCRPSCSPPTGS